MNFRRYQKIDLFKLSQYIIIHYIIHIMNYTNVTVKQFISQIITFDTIDDILNTCSNVSGPKKLN